MGSTLYVALNPHLDDIETNNDRKLLAESIGKQESTNKQDRPLSDFLSYDPQMLAQFIDDPDVRAAAIAKARPIEWFDPADALPAVKAMRDHFGAACFVRERGRRRHGQWEPVDRTEDLLGELDDLEKILLHAQSRGVKFRLYVGF